MISISHRTKYQQYIYLDGPNPPSNKQIPLKIIAYYIAQQRKDNKSWMAYWQYCHDLNWWLECRKNVLSLSEKFLKVRHVCCVMIRLLVRGNRGLLVNFGQFIEADPSTEKHQWPVSRNGVQQHKDFAPCVLNIDVHKQRAKSGHTKKKKNKRTRQLEPVRVSGSKNKTDRTSFHLPHIFSPPIFNFFFPPNDEEEEQERKNHFFYKYPRSIFICTKRNEMPTWWSTERWIGNKSSHANYAPISTRFQMKSSSIEITLGCIFGKSSYQSRKIFY